MKLRRGYTQVYTGDGKGKTTAALGLALRAAGAGLKVYIGQFIKKGYYSELRALKKYKKSITIKQFGRGCFIKNLPEEIDCRLAERGLRKTCEAMDSGRFDLVILDEINVAVKMGLLSAKDVLAIIKKKPKRIELVLTGRWACRDIRSLADLVTVMKDCKHYFQSGVLSRKGIDC